MSYPVVIDASSLVYALQFPQQANSLISHELAFMIFGVRIILESAHHSWIRVPSRNVFSIRLREGCLNLRNAFASICRIRSRVTEKR